MSKRLFHIFCLLLFARILPAQTLLQDLPRLSNPSYSFQQSSYDRTGKNDDRLTLLEENYYDVIPEGKVNNPYGTATGKMEYVISHVEGPAVVERFWVFTFPFNSEIRFRFYFDGEAVPRIDKSFNELFLSQTPPFVKPLVQNLYESSGGFYSYMQLPVGKSLIVTVDSAVVYCHFGIRQLPRDTLIQSWTTDQDNSYLVNEFAKSGTYPKNNFSATHADSTVISIPSGQSKEVYSSSGHSVIEAVHLQLPQMDYRYAAFTKDKGNFHKGSSSFRMNIRENAGVVQLIKRSNKMYHLDFNFSNLFENASVRVDNVNAGVWRNADYRTYRYWQNDTFRIPSGLVRNKNQVIIQLQYLSGEPWNEYYYWIRCDGVITDSFDVADAASESIHDYSVTNVQTNNYSELNNRYDAPDAVKWKNRQLLDSVFIKIYFDGESSPSVHAPVGLFFATGVNDAVLMQSVPCGNVQGEFYNYFSMPYWEEVRIELENKSGQPLTDARLKIRSAPNEYDKNTTGYLKTYWNKATKDILDNTDYRIAAVKGRGRYVGTVLEADQNNNFDLSWIEGDERVYVDDALTPSFHGTGTEDYFNSSVYFYLDEYCLPQNGTTNSDDFFHKSSYRFHLTDPIFFERNIRFQIEHGLFNNKLGNYQSLAFLYVQPEKTVLTDQLNVGDKSSEESHRYTAGNNKGFLYKLSSFEGEQYKELLLHDGYAIFDSVSFSVSVSPCNTGVRLLRTFDYSFGNQMAKVYVDDSLAGIWLNPGMNHTSQFREDYFVIPEKFSRYKNKLNIKLVNQNPLSEWTELYYKIYSVADTSLPCGIVNNKDEDYTVFPSLTTQKVSVSTSDEEVTSFMVVNNRGAIIQRIEKVPESVFTTVDFSSFPDGIYFIAFLQQDKIANTQKVVLLR